MKNLHLIATDKRSKLHSYCNNLTYLRLSKEALYWKEALNIYITSDEEIKEGVDQWYLDKVLNETYNSGGAQYSSKQDVIILTTDQDLIADGIQAIDDEFLEWFVSKANDGGKPIDVVKVEFIYSKRSKEDIMKGNALPKTYKIIIPNLEKYSERFDNKDNEIVEGIFNPETWGNRIVNDVPKQETEHLLSSETNKKRLLEDVSKQETLEEAGMYQQKLFNYLSDLGVIALQSEMQDIERIVLEMQQEQEKNKYSEEEVLVLLHKRDAYNFETNAKSLSEWETPKEWFEQFKKEIR